MKFEEKIDAVDISLSRLGRDLLSAEIRLDSIGICMADQVCLLVTNLHLCSRIGIGCSASVISVGIGGVGFTGKRSEGLTGADDAGRTTGLFDDADFTALHEWALEQATSTNMKLHLGE
jgi:hypothetical protein